MREGCAIEDKQDTMTTEPNRLRSDYLNTQVITRNSGKRLGVVKELLVDIDRREVVALGLRDSAISMGGGMPRYMYLSDISQTGDVILVENEDVIEDVDADGLHRLINCEVITENGEVLGRVRDFQFDVKNGAIASLVVASIGLPQIPDRLISTYELSVEEIVSSGPDRIIVFEGTEDRMVQLTEGILERFGIGKPPWEQEEIGYETQTARPDNQLPSSTVSLERKPAEEKAPIYEAWMEEEDEAELEPVPRADREPEPMRRYRYEDEPEYGDRPERETVRAYRESDREPLPAEEEEEDNWSDVPEAYYEESPRRPLQTKTSEIGGSAERDRSDRDYRDFRDDDIEEDVWEDKAEEKPYTPPPLDIPQKSKSKTPEYEEETN